MIDTLKVKGHVRKYLRGIRTAGDVARQMNISPETLRRVFLRKERVHLSDHIKEVRVEEMKEMLLNTKKRCFEICYDVGFSREDSGAKIFKRLAGVTMKEFRKNNGKGTSKS